jgi:sulfur-carrier protein
MEIKIRFFATLREGRGKEIIELVDEPITVMDLLQKYAIPIEEVAILLVNGRDGTTHHLLKDGDIISIFPPVGGG